MLTTFEAVGLTSGPDPSATMDNIKRKSTEDSLPMTAGSDTTPLNLLAASAPIREEPDVQEPKPDIIDFTPLQLILTHKSTAALEEKLGITVQQALLYLFQGCPYQSVCLCVPNWEKRFSPHEYGTFYSAAYTRMALYSYIIKRVSAILIMEDETYKISDQCASKADAAFLAFFDALIVKKKEITNDHVRDVPGHGPTVMFDNQEIVRAFRIFTEEPMKFKVQRRVGNYGEPQKVALFWFKDVEPKGKFDTSWEYMSKSLAECVHPNENYDMAARHGRNEIGLLRTFR